MGREQHQQNARRKKPTYTRKFTVQKATQGKKRTAEVERDSGRRG